MNIIKYLTSWKYRLFTKKIQGVEVAIAEADFKIAKSRQLREEIRRDRDRSVEAMQQISVALKNDKVENKEALEKDGVATEGNIRRYEAQMKMIDDQISGVPANGENPGEAGIVDTLKSYVELKKMFIDYRSKL